MYRRNVSDADIRSDIRSYMAQHRLDMQRINLRVFGGTVRLSGDVYHLGGHDKPVCMALLESFERDVMKSRGVRHAFFEFDNWRRQDGGLWESTDGKGDFTRRFEVDERYLETPVLHALDDTED